MPPVLDQIVAAAQATLPALRGRRDALEREAADAPPVPSFKEALERGSTVALIAEVKRRSPSAGTIRGDLDPATHAARYAESGAAAISVLTEGPHFGGSMADLRAVRATVGVPVHRKDFIVDEVQLLEAAAAGASAALLIVRILVPKRLKELLNFGHATGLDLLVETHTDDELAIALDVGAEIIGINSRDLDTFALDPARAWALIDRIPAGRVAVAESAMQGRTDVERAAAAGADAVLIGTALSAAADPAALASDLTSVTRHAR